MAAQIPVKAIYSGSDVTSLGEFTASDDITITYLPTGTSSSTVALGDHTHAYLPLAGGTLTGNLITTGLIDTRDVAADGVLATNAMPKSGGAFTGAITTNSTIDTVDIAVRDAILTSTTTTAGAALPKAGGTMTGTLTVNAAAVFNESSADVDFRIESNNNANAFYVDGGTDCVYFGHSSSAGFDAYGNEISVQIQGAGTAPYTGLGIIGHTNDADAGVLILGKSRGTSVGSATIVQDGDQLGRIDFQGMDGTDLETGASILAVVDGTPGANDMPAELVFRTTADGADSSTERMNIGSEGDVTVSTGDIVFATAGKGICLGVTSNTDANTLDDYEEGTFTASLTSLTSTPSTPPTCNGYYTKVGNLVYFNIRRFSDANTSGGSGHMRVDGLPFTTTRSHISGDIMMYGFAFGVDRQTTLEINADSTTIAFWEQVNGGAWATLSITAGTGKYMSLSGSYIAV